MKFVVLLLSLAALAGAAPTPVEVGARVKKSVLTVLADRRDETKVGMGSGFVISADGLMVTNLHVIGHGRPIEVKSADGTTHDVTHVVAYDRELDLAILRLKGKSWKPLKLGDSSKLAVGQDVLAVGNPQGYQYSVVTGTVSGRRTLEGAEMVQVAMPIEVGNSGGPLVDMEGRVHGVITLKSAVTPNLGLAVTVNELKKLLARPAPVTMAQWTALYAPDPGSWEPRLGARWRQKAGGLSVDGEGTGFGGRSLLVYKEAAPAPPYDVGVWVKLADESGAAGLFFLGADDDTHYGFYPSRGKLRLTRFSGPDLSKWTILSEVSNAAWRPGDWNHLKVRVEAQKLTCIVNDSEVLTSADRALTGSRAGLVKFRETRAEFREFALAPQILPVRLATGLVEKVTRLAGGAPLLPGTLPPVPLLDALVPEAPGSVRALRERARALEREAANLKTLARAVHEAAVRAELARLVEAPDMQVDLVHAALLVARLDHEDLDIEPYRALVERLASLVAARVKPEMSEDERLGAVLAVLRDQGFHGSYGGYHSKANAYMHQVLDDREGIGLTLGVLTIELARRQGVHLVGSQAPGQFVVRLGERALDPVHGGRAVDAREGRPLSAKGVIVRLLMHLLSVAHMDTDRDGMLRYLDAILTLEPDSPEERWTRGAIHAQAGRLDAARADLDWLIAKKPRGMDVERVAEYRRGLDLESSAGAAGVKK